MGHILHFQCCRGPIPVWPYRQQPSVSTQLQANRRLIPSSARLQRYCNTRRHRTEPILAWRLERRLGEPKNKNRIRCCWSIVRESYGSILLSDFRLLCSISIGLSAFRQHSLGTRNNQNSLWERVS